MKNFVRYICFEENMLAGINQENSSKYPLKNSIIDKKIQTK